MYVCLKAVLKYGRQENSLLPGNMELFQ